MNIKPVTGPLPHTPETTNSFAKSQVAREKAIAKLTQSPVQNQNQVQPEEIAALRAPSAQKVEHMSEEVEQTLETTGQNDSIEETEVTKAPPPQEDPKIQSQLAILARKEKALRAKHLQLEQSIKIKEDALAVKEAAIGEKERQYQQGYISKDQLKQDTLRILADVGVSYDELTAQIINQSQHPVDPRLQSTIEQLQTQIKTLQGQVEEGKKATETRQQEAYQSALKQIRSDVKSLVTMDPNFETIHRTSSIDDVVQLIEETYSKDGVLLSVEEACQEVEDYLVEEAMKLTQIGKIKKKLNLDKPEPKAVSQAQTPQTKQTQPMKTLTNAISGTRQLTARERAVLAFKGQLKS